MVVQRVLFDMVISKMNPNGMRVEPIIHQEIEERCLSKPQENLKREIAFPC